MKVTHEPSKPGVKATTLKMEDEGSYPAGLDEPCRGRKGRRVGDHFGLTNFGANLTELSPGAWSAQRHWHSHEDELIYVISGELCLLTDSSEQVLTAGMVVGFAAGVEDGHHLVNRSDAVAVYLEIGDRRAADECHYPDVDLFYAATGDGHKFLHKNGKPY